MMVKRYSTACAVLLYYYGTVLRAGVTASIVISSRPVVPVAPVLVSALSTESIKTTRDQNRSNAGLLCRCVVPSMYVPRRRCFAKTLTFGDYRRPSIAERAAITLATFGAIAWKAVSLFRTRQRTWSKVAVAVVAPCLAWLVRSITSYFYK